MTTVQQILDRARYTLNDPDETRYPDAELLVYFNDALAYATSRRPDLFLGQWASLPAALAAADAFPLKTALEPPFAFYVIARAESKDDEHINAGRIAQFLQLFMDGVASL